jgi:hypothetical protein
MDTNSQINRIDALLNNLVQNGKAHEIESQLEKINPDQLNPVEREAWYHG